VEISGNHFFAAQPDTVWQAICDPVTLKACIPQCESIERLSDTEWRGLARVRLGPFKVPFMGEITLSDLDPPHSYRIHITAKGWVGSGTGEARVTLTPENEGTRLAYAATAHLGIKLLDKAMSLADKVAAHLAESFFTRLAEKIALRDKAGPETAQ
jgi:carbon monoxide dehydrogenase subunit G